MELTCQQATRGLANRYPAGCWIASARSGCTLDSKPELSGQRSCWHGIHKLPTPLRQASDLTQTREVILACLLDNMNVAELEGARRVTMSSRKKKCTRKEACFDFVFSLEELQHNALKMRVHHLHE